MFVAVDGPNGVGKTSTIAAVVRRLEGRGTAVCSIRQPSETDLGDFIRLAESRYDGLTFAALVVADRIQLADTVVRPAVAEGKLVITDRHIASTLALQQVDGVDMELLWELNAGVLKPDLSVFLNAPPEVLETRLNDRGRTSRFEHTAGISASECQYFAQAAQLMSREGLRVMQLSTVDLDVEAVAAQIDAAIEATAVRVRLAD